MAEQQLEALRLLKAYRSYRPGEVIHATPGLAAFLKSDGVAVHDDQRTFLPGTGAERAVEARSKIETR